jgi:hypothetical protein
MALLGGTLVATDYAEPAEKGRVLAESVAVAMNCAGALAACSIVPYGAAFLIFAVATLRPPR